MKLINRKILIFCTIAFILVSLSSCHLGYKVKGEKVFFTYWNEGVGTRTFEVEGADALTFKVLKHSTYAKDMARAYYKGNSIQGSDHATFTSLLDYYAKDYKYAYLGRSLIKGAEGKTFEVIDGGPYSRDKKDFYFDTTALHVSNMNSFIIIKKPHKYGYWAKDEIHYYITNNKYPLSDYDSFEVLGEGYAKDMYKAYFQGKVVEGADPKTFRVIEYGYAEDKTSKYERHQKLNIEDPLSYKVIQNGFTKDKFHVYYKDTIVAGADPSTFRIVDWKWSKDNKTYFYQGKAMPSIDYNTFETLRANYAKDKNTVYFYNYIVAGADATTFEVDVFSHIGKDKYGCFKNGKKTACILD